MFLFIVFRFSPNKGVCPSQYMQLRLQMLDKLKTTSFGPIKGTSNKNPNTLNISFSESPLSRASSAFSRISKIFLS
ncbi:MAG: hypothetical protein ACPLWC_02235 [Candidatus Woesearchaeota archaeon]